MTQEQLNKIQEFTKTITNPKLLGIIRRLKQSAEKKTNPTPEDQANYITELVNAKLLAPVAVTAMSGEKDNQIRVQFSSLADPKKDRYFMVFTDYETLRRNIKDSDKVFLLSVTYKDLAGMLSDPACKMTGFVINPFTENIICGPQQAQVIGNFIRQQKFNSGELTVINEVTGVPDEVTSPMSKYFDARRDVKKAYIMNMRKVDRLNRLIIVDFEGDKDAFNDFTKDFTEKVLKDINDEKAPFVIMDFAQDAAKAATKEKVPFYVKV